MSPSLRQGWQRWVARRTPMAKGVTLTQRRIFIMPSLQGGAFFGVLLVMLLAAINYQNSLAYALTFLLGSLFFVTILHTYRNLAGLGLSAAGGDDVFVGEQARFRINLESAGRAHQAIALFGADGVPVLLDVPVATATVVNVAFVAERRGWLRPGRLRVETRFPLGLLVAWSWVELDQQVLVYPKPLPVPLPAHVFTGQSRGDSNGAQVHGPGVDDYQGLKPYQPGDSRRRMHWKAYSRGQGLLVKDFSAETGDRILLDYGALNGPCEVRLSQLCHWVMDLANQGRPFALSLPGQQVEAGAGHGHRQRCLKALALMGGDP